MSRELTIKICLVAVAHGIIGAAASIALADGVIRDGLGARSGGRGGTNFAFSDNGEVLLDNPAGIANMSGRGLVEMGADVLLTDLDYSDPDNPRTSADNDPFPSGQFSILKKSADGDWAWGLGVYSLAGFSAEYNLNGPAQLPGPRFYKSLGMLAKVLPGVAHRVTDRLSIGGTLGVGISHVELEAPYFLQSPGPFRGSPLMLDLQGTGAAIVWSAGLQYELSEATTIGLAYQSDSRFHLDGSSLVENPLLGQTRFDTRTDITWPQSVGVGVRHEWCRHRIFAADVIWYDWSQAFDDVGLRFSQSTNPAYDLVVGPVIYERFPLNWRDTVSVRLGHEHFFTPHNVLRLGYIYHRNPIPESTLTTYIQATLEHAFSVGYGRRFGCFDVDLAYQFSFGNDRTVDGTTLAGSDYEGGTFDTTVHWAFLSFLRRF